ncbi:hypothetical protein [Leptospira noguchii]|uniref:hypothetical protein n=1 Tax=Leptospira noguchii TaxID=28182 RepID=UPI001FB733F1|nr:hypothetical protein [Leptospira noguchii]UOG36314.1 hypothetical protein MAL02_19400 [Leptospira noguchii]
MRIAKQRFHEYYTPDADAERSFVFRTDEQGGKPVLYSIYLRNRDGDVKRQ